jgi:hypothetical protein
MTVEERQVIDDIANALAAAVVPAAHVRRTATEQINDTVQLEEAVDRAARAIKRLAPNAGA